MIVVFPDPLFRADIVIEGLCLIVIRLNSIARYWEIQGTKKYESIVLTMILIKSIINLLNVIVV